MSDTDKRDEWAWARVEAMADDSLAAEERLRMLDALRRDPRLRAAVGRARELRRGLKALGRTRVPAGLWLRLLRVPGRRAPWSTHWSLLAAPVAAAGLAIAVIALVERPAPPAEDARVAAIHDFELAMRYLQKSAEYTGSEVGGAVGGALMGALVAGRNSLLEDDDENGG